MVFWKIVDKYNLVCDIYSIVSIAVDNYKFYQTRGRYMKNTKTDKTSRQIKILFGFCFVLMAVVIGLLWKSYEHGEYIYDDAVSRRLSFFELREEDSKLRFCLARDIKKCDDESIEKWNDAHPNDKFVIKKFEDLAEMAVDAVRQARGHYNSYYN